MKEKQDKRYIDQLKRDGNARSNDVYMCYTRHGSKMSYIGTFAGSIEEIAAAFGSEDNSYELVMFKQSLQEIPDKKDKVNCRVTLFEEQPLPFRPVDIYRGCQEIFTDSTYLGEREISFGGQ